METNKDILIKCTDPIYTLSVASKYSEIPKHSIRQYIDKGLIIPFVTKTGRHQFSNLDILRLKNIKKSIQQDGLNIAGINKINSLVPCWSIKKCPEEERNQCEAYTSTTKPCWEASQKGFTCMNSECRECEVYRFPESFNSLKALLIEKIK